jgi:methionyl-tRNA formyltransferase
MLAKRCISIENIHADIVRSGAPGKQTFQVEAHLLVPANLSMGDVAEGAWDFD